MLHITLKEWSQLSTEQRKQWLDDKSMLTLTELLQMLEEVTDINTDMGIELSMLDLQEPVISARDFTRDTLTEVKHYVVTELKERSEQLISRTV
jgi:hypothetical protein